MRQRPTRRAGCTSLIVNIDFTKTIMRLTQEQVQQIKIVVNQFDPNARIILFGSRADDDKKGGDIDLLIFSERLTRSDQSKIRIGLENRLGLQRFDIIIEKDARKPFVRHVFNEGIAL